MTLRVAVDATALPAQRVGAGISTIEVLRASQNERLDIHVFVNDRQAAELGENLPFATLHPVKTPARPVRLLWGHVGLGRRVAAVRPDVFWGPHYTLPHGLSCPAVVTFHDPTFFTLPRLHERSKVLYFRRAARGGIARAARVVTPSAYARRGAVEHAGAHPGRTDVVPWGVDSSRFRPGRREHGQGPYILFVGALEPRKDIPTLIDAYERLARDGMSHELVLAGPPAWGRREVEAALARLEHGNVRRTGYVTEEEKVLLYQGASLFVYPSIAEGFGLPVLEALACGTPVVTTTGSAPEEVAGDAALLVPPGNPGHLAEAMARVLGDATLAASLGRAGVEQAASFTWAEAAERMEGVWQEAAAGAGGEPGHSSWGERGS